MISATVVNRVYYHCVYVSKRAQHTYRIHMPLSKDIMTYKYCQYNMYRKTDNVKKTLSIRGNKSIENVVYIKE